MKFKHKRIIIAFFIALSLGLLMAVSGLFDSSTAKADNPHKTEDVFVIGTGEVVGEATLVRNKNGATVTIHTSGLTPGEVLTVWGVVFNNPDACAGDCGAPDLANPDVRGSAQWLTGHVVGGSGTATFAAHIAKDDTSNVSDAFPINSDGLEEPLTAEIHFVVRTHGQKISGLVGEQMSTLNGGCPPNACVNVQASLFK